MALDEFWINFRNAVSYYATTAEAAASYLGASIPELVQRDAVRWLALRSAEGFDLNDFRFLSKDEQAALRASVERFRAAASQVLGNNPVPRPLVEGGRTAFAELLRILQPYRFRDVESLRTQVLLERDFQGKLPRWVTGISCETGTDHMGEEAIWIWIHVTDEATTKGTVEKGSHALRELVKEAYHQIGGRLWPFIRFRSPDAFARRGGGAA
jgi:hypothetical protein